MNPLFNQGGKGSVGILTNKQAVARHFGVKQSEVVYFAVGVDISGYRVIYDKNTQRAYSLPSGLPAGTTAISLSAAAVLVHSGGSSDLGAVGVSRGEFINVAGDFSVGTTINTKNELISYNGTQYRWSGALPKTVGANSTPDSTGGVSAGNWVTLDRADTLRKELASTSGVSKIGMPDGRTVQDWVIANDTANYRARNISKLAWVDKQVHSRGAIKVLFQGDSMTAGYDVVTKDSVPPENGDWARHADMTYPKRFMQFLPEQSGCQVTGVIRAISGHTAIQSYNQAEWQSNPNCDVVILMLGLNDASGVADTTENIYMEYMEKLIRRFIDWGMGVVIQTCSWSGQNNGAIVGNQWARRIRTVANIYGCAHFNADEVQYYRHNGAITSDGGHFNSMGYAIHGQMLASMFMAGGLVPTFRPLTNEMTTWPGRMDDSIGYCDTYGNVNLGRADGAYTRVKIAGVLPDKKVSILTFSFYLDADAAHIYGHVAGIGPIGVITDATAWWNNGQQDYYAFANNQAVNFQNNDQADPNITVDLSSTYAPTRKFIGRLLGRGWKTVTLFTPLDGSGGEAYVNSLTFQPVPVGFSVQARNWERWDKGMKSVIHRKFPSPYGRSGLPDPVALNGFTLPVPQSMLPVTPKFSGDLSSEYYNCSHAVMKISNSSGEYIEALLVKISTGYAFTGKIIKTTYTDAAKPTAITAKLVHRQRTLLKAANANGTSQPLENIYNTADTYVDLPNTDYGGLALNVSITWPSGTSASSYWNVEVEFTDFFGSSEASI